MAFPTDIAARVDQIFEVMYAALIAEYKFSQPFHEDVAVGEITGLFLTDSLGEEEPLPVSPVFNFDQTLWVLQGYNSFTEYQNGLRGLALWLRQASAVMRRGALTVPFSYGFFDVTQSAPRVLNLNPMLRVNVAEQKSPAILNFKTRVTIRIAIDEPV